MSAHGLWIAIGCTVLIRIVAIAFVAQELRSDGLGYFTLARTLAENGVMVDQFGFHTFYSPGYPLLLAPFFWAFGSGTPVAHVVNIALAGVSAALVWRLARAIGATRGAALLAGLGYAVWFPAIWAATDLSRENLSTPLLAGFAILCVEIAHGRSDWRRVVAAGMVYAAGLLAGTSSVLTGAGFAVALAIALHRTPAAGAKRLAIFGLTAVLVLTPWFYAADRMVGRPLLTSNGPFNLYIGNNPAATGRFVSVRDTPIADRWHEQVAVLGEAGVGDWLTDETRTWIGANPGRTAVLAMKKLALFWAPNVPDRADIAASPTLSVLRIVDLIQWATILLLGGAALIGRGIDQRARWTLAAIIAGYWVVHAATYVIARYRDPVMPVLICLAAVTVWYWCERRWPALARTAA